jgi:hypothetical protein
MTIEREIEALGFTDVAVARIYGFGVGVSAWRDGKLHRHGVVGNVPAAQVVAAFRRSAELDG